MSEQDERIAKVEQKIEDHIDSCWDRYEGIDKRLGKIGDQQFKILLFVIGTLVAALVELLFTLYGK